MDLLSTYYQISFCLYILGEFFDFIMQEAIPTILNETPKSFFDTRQSYLRDNAELAYSRLDDIPSLKCDFKPEACTFLWVLYFYHVSLRLNYKPFYYYLF